MIGAEGPPNIAALFSEKIAEKTADVTASEARGGGQRKWISGIMKRLGGWREKGKGEWRKEEGGRGKAGGREWLWDALRRRDLGTISVRSRRDLGVISPRVPRRLNRFYRTID